MRAAQNLCTEKSVTFSKKRILRAVKVKVHYWHDWQDGLCSDKLIQQLIGFGLCVYEGVHSKNYTTIEDKKGPQSIMIINESIN
jgi:hypothetical protein